MAALGKLRRAVSKIEDDLDEEKVDPAYNARGRGRGREQILRGRIRGGGRGRARGRGRGRGERGRGKPQHSRQNSRMSRPSLSRLSSIAKEEHRPSSREKWQLAAIKTQYKMIVNTLAKSGKTKGDQIKAQEEQLKAQADIIKQLKSKNVDIKSVNDSQIKAANAELKFVKADNEELKDKIKKLEKDFAYANGHIQRLQKENDVNTGKHAEEVERNKKLVEKNNLLNEKINMIKTKSMDKIIHDRIAQQDPSEYHLQIQNYGREDQEKLVCLLTNYERICKENEIYSRQIFASQRQSAMVNQKLSELEMKHQSMRDKFRASEDKNLKQINVLQQGMIKWKNTAQCYEKQLKKMDDDLYFHGIVFENIRKRISVHIHRQSISSKPSSIANRLSLPSIVRMNMNQHSKSAEFTQSTNRSVSPLCPIAYRIKNDQTMSYRSKCNAILNK